VTQFNRLDPAYLKTWRVNYRDVFDSFKAGSISLLDAVECLRHLGFKDDALKIEMLELQKAKREAQGPALKLVMSTDAHAANVSAVP
jgi:hypothetical protein